MGGLSPIGPGAAAGPTMTLPPATQQQLQAGALQALGQQGQFTSNIANNQFGGPMVSGAVTASQMGETGAQNQFSAGQNLLNQYPQLFQAGNQVFNTALDPQQALYNRYLGLTEQQFQATNALSGVGSTPYAAGLNAQNLQNFNISWNAQQLQNQISGLNAMVGAYGQGANIAGAGSQLQAGAAPLFMQSAAMPYNAYNLTQQTPLNAFQQLQQGQQSLLGMQPSLASAQNQTASTQAALQQQMINQLGGGIGALAGLGLAPFTGGASLGAMGGMFGGMGALNSLFGGGGLGLPGNQGYGYINPTDDVTQDFMQDAGY